MPARVAVRASRETRVKDLLERVLKLLPGYLPDLASLVTRPKTAMLRWVGEAAGDLTRPLTFVGVSVAIGFLLQLPQLGKEDVFTTLVASMSAFKVLALVMFSAIIELVFRVAGGHASFSATLSALYRRCNLGDRKTRNSARLQSHERHCGMSRAWPPLCGCGPVARIFHRRARARGGLCRSELGLDLRGSRLVCCLLGCLSPASWDPALA